MRTCTVRLDEETEETLEDILRLTGLDVSEVLRRGIKALHVEVARAAAACPYDVYATLDLGPGGHSRASAEASARAIKDIIRRKHQR